MDLSVILLAAGHGTRMRSDTPKVLHKVAGFAMLEHVVSIATSIPENSSNFDLKEVIIVTSDDLETHKDFKNITNTYDGVKTVVQKYKFGTGHAVHTGLDESEKSDAVLVMYCDVPLITLETVLKLLETFSQNNFDVVGTAFEHHGNKPYGRFELDVDGTVRRVVEASDIDDLNPMLTNLCNAGMLVADYSFIKNFLHGKCLGLTHESFEKEIYLTDIFESGASSYIKVSEEEAMGVNNRVELAAAEDIFQKRIRDRMMKRGVTLIAPETVFFSADTVINHDTIIHPYVKFGVDVEVGYGAEIRSFCDIEGATIGNKTSIGPFARIRPNTQVEDNCKVGNFVELKNAYLSEGSKSSHLSYLGDVHIGSNTNVGAGVIICNYDGVNKHHTTIGSDVQIGANSSIISPRYIGDSAKIGAGSVITDDVMDMEIAIARTRQINKKRKEKRPS